MKATIPSIFGSLLLCVSLWFSSSLARSFASSSSFVRSPLGGNTVATMPSAAVATDAAAASAAALRESLENGTSRDAEERVCTVLDGKRNVPTAEGHPRREVRLNNLWHRATYVVVRHVLDDDDEEEHVLVQRRSTSKDYCPGRLDPAPGGVVGFGESCDDNARRELEEEMGIDGTTWPATRRFSFAYEDGRARCWGELYEVAYGGPLSALTLQEEEVDEVLRVPLSTLRRTIDDGDPNDEWLPDGLHALRLWLQHRTDARVGRRLLPETPGSNLDAYELRPRPRVVFFDCDDCLYFNDWATADLLTKRIETWCVEKLGLSPGEAYRLYKRHGTALKGLLAEGLLEQDRVATYLAEVHDVPLDGIRPDPELRGVLSRMDPATHRIVFTASVAAHAERCLRALGVRDLFPPTVVDTAACGLETKHSSASFDAALTTARRVFDAPDLAPNDCLLLDDSVKNVSAARRNGWRAVLVGRRDRDTGAPVECEDAELEIDRVHDVERVLPELFS